MLSKKLIFALVLLFAIPAQAGIVRDLELSSNLVLHQDYRSGTYSDRSGNPANGTPTDVTWQGDGSTFLQSTSVITVADDATLQLTSLSITVCGNLMHQGTETLVSKQDAGGTNYTVSLTATNINLYDGTNTRTIAASIVGKRCVTVQATNGATGEVFLDGIREGALDANSALSVDDAPLLIGNDYDDGDNASNPIHSVVIISRELTDTEAARLYSELVNTTWPTAGQSQAVGSYGPELVVDGDMEAATTAAWTAANNATLTKESGGPLAGDHVLRVARNGTNSPNARQTILISGTQYRAQLWARGDGTYYPFVGLGSGVAIWTGTTSTNWQEVDEVAVADGVTLRLYSSATAAGYSEFDNVSVTEAENTQTQFKTDWDVKVSTGLTAGYIPGTAWQIGSGTWSVSTETVNGAENKVIENMVAGIVYLDGSEIQGGPTQGAYGTWDFWLNKSSGGAPRSIFIADVAGSDSAAGQDGYSFLFGSAERIDLRESVNGTPASKFFTGNGYMAHSTWIKFTVTRSEAGVFTAYMDDVLIDTSGGAGSNPFTDSTTKISFYWVFDLDAGDKVIYSSRAGNYSISKQHGVQ